MSLLYFTIDWMSRERLKIHWGNKRCSPMRNYKIMMIGRVLHTVEDSGVTYLTMKRSSIPKEEYSLNVMNYMTMIVVLPQLIQK